MDLDNCPTSLRHHPHSDTRRTSGCTRASVRTPQTAACEPQSHGRIRAVWQSCGEGQTPATDRWEHWRAPASWRPSRARRAHRDPHNTGTKLRKLVGAHTGGIRPRKPERGSGEGTVRESRPSWDRNGGTTNAASDGRQTRLGMASSISPAHSVNPPRKPCREKRRISCRTQHSCPRNQLEPSPGERAKWWSSWSRATHSRRWLSQPLSRLEKCSAKSSEDSRKEVRQDH